MEFDFDRIKIVWLSEPENFSGSSRNGPLERGWGGRFHTCYSSIFVYPDLYSAPSFIGVRERLACVADAWVL